MYGNYNDSHDRQIINDLSVSNLIGIANTEDVWKEMSDEEKKGIIEVLRAYARGCYNAIKHESNNDCNVPIKKFLPDDK